MNRPLTILLAAAMLLLARAGQATIHQVNVSNFAFSPTKTTVNPGDTVRWVLVSGFHTSTSTGGSPKAWDSGTLTSGVPFDVVFTSGDGPGPFPYLCSFHPLTMIDTIFMNAPAAEPTYFPFLLNEAQANSCAGTGSNARGWGWAVLSPDSTQLSIYIEHDVASPTDAHVHLGLPCVSGGIVLPFASPTSPISETFPLDATNRARLLNGELYVNIHSPVNPAGDIRGQIAQEPIKFIFTLDGAQAAGGSGTGSCNTGLAVCELSGDASSLSVEITHDIPVDSAIDGHIHLGAPGVSGSIQFGFTGSTSPVSEVWPLDTVDVKNLLAGDLYINLHTPAFPGGEIRGQIAREPIRWAFPMDGVEGGTASSATGFVVCELNDQLSDFSLYAEHDVANVTDGHIHLGAIGVNGSIQFGFSSSASPISESWALDAADIDNLLAGDLYVNIHSTDFPGGEIRGQIDHESVSLSFGLDEAQANSCAGTGSPATGDASVLLKIGGRAMTIAGTHDVVGPVDAHIHLGTTCVSGSIHYPFTSPTSPFKEIWFLDFDDIVNLMQQELYVNIHSGAFPGGEIRGQLIADAGCCDKRGDADGNSAVNVGDLTYMVNYLFKGGAAPVCNDPGASEGDGDGNGAVNVGDLTYLVNYLFKGGASPVPCP